MSLDVSSQQESDFISEFFAQKRSEQNFNQAILAALAAAVISAALWAVITVTTQFQIGFMAIGVGFLVGYAIKTFGKGMDEKFAYLGAGMSLIGCLLGNLFSAVGFVAAYRSTGFFDLLFSLNLDSASSLLSATFQPLDLLFYGIGIYRGYKHSVVQFTQQEIEAARLAAQPSGAIPPTLPTA